MPSSRDDDLDWLYGRERRGRAPDPEPTRVLPPAGGPSGPPTREEPVVPVAPRPPDRPLPPPPPPVSSAATRPPRTRRRRPARTGLAVLGALLALALLGLVAVPAYAWSQIERVDATPTGEERPGDQPGTTFLLVGSDSREGLSAEEQKRLGTGDTAGQRTDTIMIVSIPADGRPALISVPRDSYVPVPGNGKNKINAAYAIGGPKLLVATVEGATGLRVDGYMEIGFGGFVNVIDALGGIQMCLPKAVEDRDSKIDLPKGCQTLDGANALGYVRMRKADVRGDLGRVERQREMLAAVAQEAASPATVLNPVRYARVSTSTARAIKLGEDTGFAATVRMGLAMRRIASGDGLTLTVPVADPDASTSAGSAVLWDSDRAKDMFSDIAAGDTSDLQKYAE